MNTNKKTARILEDVQIKLSALWVALMFIWQQGDVLRLYSGDFISGDDIGGKLISQEMLWLVGAIWMTIPVIMIFLSLTLKYKANRWANIILGIFYTCFMLYTMLGSTYAYYIFLGIVEVVLTALIVWYAWKWPKQEG